MSTRRQALRALAAAVGAGGATALAGCQPAEGPGRDANPLAALLERIGLGRAGEISGGFVGASHERGHRLRTGDFSAPGTPRRTTVAIVGGGIAGLSAARQLRRAGITDYRLFELEDEVGGNSRAGQVAGVACPWGAHYLPVPGERAQDLRELLQEFGVLKIEAGRPLLDERVLCHAPQERLLIGGRWQSGLLPLESAATDDARRFAARVNLERAGGRFGLPSDLAQARGPLAALDRQSFAAWLDDQRLISPPLRWYLDYCCRDDYGAPSDQVSAWAGLHYFASRHGFFVPGTDHADPAADDVSEVLTWPEGNGWLVTRLAQAHRERIVPSSVVHRVDAQRGAVTLDAWSARDNRSERWQADFVILAVPLFVAARMLVQAPPALSAIVPRLRYASWLVANLYLPAAPKERPGAARAWDNVIYGGESLGYVDAMHQSLRSAPGATVFTWYQALGISHQSRANLYESSWRDQVERILADLARAHPDIRQRTRHVDIMRWGHAMLAPTPGLRSDPAFAELGKPLGRVQLAHSDLAGYSVFEEAFAHGSAAGRWAAAQVTGRPQRQ